MHFEARIYLVKVGICGFSFIQCQSSLNIIISSYTIGMIEEQTGRCIFWVVLQRNAETLLKIIEDHIAAGSTIKSDEWSLSRPKYTWV